MGLDQTIDITGEQRKTILALLEHHLPDTDAWVYGSRGKWTSRPQSDLDLVVFATNQQRRQVDALREAFEESDLPFRVDLFVWDEVPVSFRERIKAEQVTLVEKDSLSVRRNWLYRPQFPAHWGRMPLYAMAHWVNGLAFRDIQFSATGKPVIKIAEIKRGISNQTKFTHQTFDESVCVRSGDLLFSWSGQPETSIDAFWWRGREGWLNQHVFRVTPINGIDTTFLFYLLRYLKPNFVGIARNKQTTGLGHVTRRDLENIEAAAPPLPEQRAIAHILGTLDDKIELNRQMNQTLEAMARALFKSWFVDFDPVRAKMEGRDIGPPKEISDLFPDRLVDSELGEIPEGWNTWRLQELADHHTQSITPSSDPEAEFDLFSIPAYDAAQLPEGVLGEAIGSNKAIVPPNAVLLSKLNPAIPRVWMPKKSSGRLQVCSTEFLVFTPRRPATRSLLFSVFTNMSFQNMMQSVATGTSGSHQRVPANGLKLRKVLAGERALMGVFGDLVTPVLARTIDARAESRTLAALRDALLPKLVSGEWRVKGHHKPWSNASFSLTISNRETEAAIDEDSRR